MVTINYRLNAFGFLCHPEITAEAPEAPANFGHLDQQAATRWVQRNIGAFGGDPDNLTIGGQSAGGSSVMNQLTSPQNKDLCQRAIVQSGLFNKLYPNPGMPRFLRTIEEAEREGIQFFSFLGANSLEEARKLDAVYVRDKMVEYNKAFWGTVVDHKFSVGNAFELFLQNKRLQVPVMLGHTTDEFLSIPEAASRDEFRRMAVEMFDQDANAFLELCGFSSDILEEVISKASVNGIEYAIRIAGQANADTGADIPFYYYNFEADIPGWDNPGAFHSVDLWFFFETLAKCWRPFVGKHYDLARQMCNYWANFIRTGDPNGKDSTGEEMPIWEPYTPDAPFGMKFAGQAEFAREVPDDIMKFLVKAYFRQNQRILAE